MEFTQSETFGPEDLLASIQSYIIYIIMRVIDDTAYHSEHDLNMLLNFAVRFFTVASYQVLRAVLIEMQKNKTRLSAVASARFVKAHSVFQNKHTLARAGRTGYSPNLGAGATIYFDPLISTTGCPNESKY
jgi:hypothetical protein